MALKLNIGCWHTWREDAINIESRLDPSWPDKEGMFLKNRLDGLENLFYCESVDEIWANDVFAGRSYSDVARMLQSWQQVLKVGGCLHLLVDAQISMAFLVGILRELGYNVTGMETNGRWASIEVVRHGIH